MVETRVLFDPARDAGSSPSRTAHVALGGGERTFPRVLEESRGRPRFEMGRSLEKTGEMGRSHGARSTSGRTETDKMQEKEPPQRKGRVRERASDETVEGGKNASPSPGSETEGKALRRRRDDESGASDEAIQSLNMGTGTAPTALIEGVFPLPVMGEGGTAPKDGPGTGMKGTPSLSSLEWIQVRLAPGSEGGNGSSPPVAKTGAEEGATALLARDMRLLRRIFGTVEILVDKGQAEGDLLSQGKSALPAGMESAAPATTMPKAVPSTAQGPAQGAASNPLPFQDPDGLAEAARRNGIQDLHAHILEELRGKIDPTRNEARIRLSPPELGEIKIHLALQDHRLTVRMEVQENAVRHLLARDLDQLRHTLSEAGLEVDRFDIQARSEGRNAFRQRTGGERSEGRPAHGGNREQEGIAPASASLEGRTAKEGPAAAAAGRVDYLVY